MWCSHSRLIVERALYSASTRPKPLREDSEARMPNPESRGAPFFLERPTNHIDFFNDSCTARRIPCKARWFGHIKQPSNTSPLQNTPQNRHAQPRKIGVLLTARMETRSAGSSTRAKGRTRAYSATRMVQHGRTSPPATAGPLRPALRSPHTTPRHTDRARAHRTAPSRDPTHPQRSQPSA